MENSRLHKIHDPQLSLKKMVSKTLYVTKNEVFAYTLYIYICIHEVHICFVGLL